VSAIERSSNSDSVVTIGVSINIEVEYSIIIARLYGFVVSKVLGFNLFSEQPKT
jgi:hypothetical protein